MSDQTPAPDYLAEAAQILADESAIFVPRREHLIALQGALAHATKVSALTNRALIGTMLDKGVATICIPAGLIAEIEAQHFDLNLEFTRGAIIASIVRPLVAALPTSPGQPS